jgi:putative membrane-bound dehydrogenase-like protein
MKDVLFRACCCSFLFFFLIAQPAVSRSAQQDWQEVQVPDVWKKMPAGMGGYSWYRTWVTVPETWHDRAIEVFVEPVDDAREVFLNGRLIGGSGKFPPQFRSGLGDRDRHPVKNDALRFGQPNRLAVRVYSSDGRSGFNVAVPVLFGGDEAIRLEGSWQFRAGDDPSWGASEERTDSDSIEGFARLESSSDVQRKLRRLPGEAGPLPVTESLKRFVTPDDLKVEVVLSEPQIGQPLDFKFDERGRLWVMNYKQYPSPAGLTAVSRDKYLRTVYDKVPPPPPHHFRGKDAITIHEDTDGDGQYDDHRTFVDGLNIATSFARGRGGVFVLNPPYLLFFADRDQDDVPDGAPEVLLEGFGMEDSHSVANNLRWGPDGWLYAAQGSTVTGQIKRYGTDEKPVHSMGQLIWRYHPEQRRYEVFAEGGGNTFGVEIDSKGRIFSGHNGGDTRGFHYVQGGYYRKGFGKHGELSNPYAFGYFQQMMHHSVPRFTHTFIIYEGAALSAHYAGRLFGVGPLQSHVICSDLQPQGSSFATNDLNTVLTSSDPWFRPVQIRVGPDGAIYVADFHEQRIDHASHYQGRVTPETGRIYRLRDPQARQPFFVDLSGATSNELVQLLEHDNKWQRQIALRLLADENDASIRGPLLEILEEKTGQTALEALWALYVSGGIDSDDLASRLLQHDEPHVRKWTVRLLCDAFQVSDRIAVQFARMAEAEPDIEVRVQLACSARRLDPAHSIPIVERLTRTAETTDSLLPLLLWWAMEHHADQGRVEVLALFRSAEFWKRPVVKENLVQRLMRRYAQAGTQSDLVSCATLLEQAPTNADVQLLLRGFEEAYAGRTLSGLPDELIGVMAKVGGGSLTLRVRRGNEDAIAEALDSIRDERELAETRSELIRVLGQIEQPKSLPVLLTLLDESRDASILNSLFTALQAYDSPSVATHVLSNYARLGTADRASAASLLTSRRSWGAQLIARVQDGRVASGDISPAAVQKLLLHADDEIRQQVQQLWPNINASTSDELRAEVLRVQDILSDGSGNPYLGKKLFLEHCGKCHQFFTDGGRIGPNLTSYKRDDLRGMLLNVINPSLEIREGFENFVVYMDDGRTLMGFIADQDNRVVVLKTADSQTLILRRDEIEEMRAVKRSLMPEEILKPLSTDQLQDLFAYLRSSQPLP